MEKESHAIKMWDEITYRFQISKAVTLKSGPE